MLTFALAGCGGRERASEGDEIPPVAGDDAGVAALPAPTATPGASVTGMPTAPPAVSATEPVPAPDAAPLPEPVADTDANSAPDATTVTDAAAAGSDSTGTVATPAGPAPLTAADASAAAGVVTQYMAAVSAGSLARGQALWATTPNDSAVLDLARGPEFGVTVGTPAPDAGGHAVVPVDVRGKADDGSDRRLQAVYTLQRGPNGSWRLQSAAVRDAAP